MKGDESKLVKEFSFMLKPIEDKNTRNLKEMYIDQRTDNDHTALTDIGINRSVNMTPKLSEQHKPPKPEKKLKKKTVSFEDSMEQNLVNLDIEKAQTPPPHSQRQDKFSLNGKRQPKDSVFVENLVIKFEEIY